MKIRRFRTNAKCAGCVAAIGAALDKAGLAGRWSVDVASPDKILTVYDGPADTEIIRLAATAGFKAEPLDE